MEKIQFGDGTVWDVPTVHQLALGATGGADIITGYSTGDQIQGLGGNDSLYGNEGNDILEGGAGDDTLYGGYGDDLLDGGAGNDRLYGGDSYNNYGYGNDTYVFGRGSGSDTIYDYDYTTGNMDTIEFGVNPLDLIFSKSGSNLMLSIQGTTDQLTVQSWCSGPSYQTEVIKASNGDILLNNQVDQLIQAMASFCTNNSMSWNQAIQEKPQDVQTILAQYWTPSQQ